MSMTKHRTGPKANTIGYRYLWKSESQWMWWWSDKRHVTKLWRTGVQEKRRLSWKNMQQRYK